MESSPNKSSETSSTPKRKQSDDEYSPESQQPQKVHKKMNVPTLVWNEVLEGIRKINNIEQCLSNVMQQMAKSEELEPLRSDIAEIKNSQALIQEKIESIEKRVSDLENDIDELKQSDVEGMISDFDDIKARTQQLSQSNLNNFLIVRHFPVEIKNDRKELLSCVNKIFTTLEFDINPNEYDVMALKVHNKELAFIQIKFSTQLLKSKVINKFRLMKRTKANEPQFFVEMFTGLSTDHSLNGTMISMHNRLTKFNVDLLQAARKHVPNHFDFVFDDADGRILAKNGTSFSTICSNQDISKLVAKIDATKRQRPPPDTSNSSRSLTLRSGRGGTAGNSRGAANTNRGR